MEAIMQLTFDYLEHLVILCLQQMLKETEFRKNN